MAPWTPRSGFSAGKIFTNLIFPEQKLFELTFAADAVPVIAPRTLEVHNRWTCNTEAATPSIFRLSQIDDNTQACIRICRSSTKRPFPSKQKFCDVLLFRAAAVDAVRRHLVDGIYVENVALISNSRPRRPHATSATRTRCS